jgi:hypothetical protein
MGTLRPTWPASMCFSKYRAVAPLWVKAEAPLPSARCVETRSETALRIAPTSSERLTLVSVDELDGVIESVGLDDDEHRSKDLLSVRRERGSGSVKDFAWRRKENEIDALVAVHVGGRFQDRRSDKVALLEPGHLDIAAVEEDLAALVLARLDQLFDALLRLRGDQRTAAGIKELVSRVCAKYGFVEIHGLTHPSTGQSPRRP